MITASAIRELPLCPKCLYRADRKAYRWEQEERDRPDGPIEWVAPDIAKNLRCHSAEQAKGVTARTKALPLAPPVPVYDDASNLPLIPDLRTAR
ncbi:hypothetical protein SEA_SKOG_42 [Gordonia phage Skog]|uniref:Uncharacterized protein n=1 Tax=Gordonia phage Skog TaxID=2704033 RepID=A0A6G6XJK0_9CAUD|nr:hypothetical protein KHQ85_gp042 [Gordonia phage Skog]QIG58194.1 hypothetical protein SEA_SKOG_42 [Gordonia phage Skog]